MRLIPFFRCSTLKLIRNTSLGFAAEETAVELARFMIAREQIQEFRLEFKAKVRSSCALE